MSRGVSRNLTRTVPTGAVDAAACLTYTGFLAVTFQELESIMTPFGP